MNVNQDFVFCMIFPGMLVTSSKYELFMNLMFELFVTSCHILIFSFILFGLSFCNQSVQTLFGTYPGCQDWGFFLLAYIAFNACLVAYLVQVVCGDAGLQLGSHYIQHFSSQSADLAHALLRLGIQNLEFVPVDQAGALWEARFSIVGVWYRLGDGALGRQRVNGSQSSSEGIRRERVEEASYWIRFRDDLRRENAVENTVLSLALSSLVHRLVVALQRHVYD